MTRLSVLAGSIVLLALSGVNAGPCRPSSSVITTSLETTATLTEISELTKTLESTSLVEPEVIETPTITLSTTETTSAAAETTETTKITAVPTPTTAETTTAAISTTSAAPVPETHRSCIVLPNPYTAPDGSSFTLSCNNHAGVYGPIDNYIVTSFEDCLLKCTEDSICVGVEYMKSITRCTTLFAAGSPTNDNSIDIAVKN
ncbi:hypothetical protein EDB82DRAFT_522463 [Fusarium venenatum]|uniref:uncharacterized protein n=1 Tax=Fusarium venenatum TaxID=56646 RepID=UPI001E06C455|nr:hypothetical protein EDB82DRAFT_522463 [Fusarium venenatum]